MTVHPNMRKEEISMENISLWLRAHYPWLVLAILLILVFDVLLHLGDRGLRETKGRAPTAPPDPKAEGLVPCSSRPGPENRKPCEIFSKEYQLLQMDSIVVIEAQRVGGSVTCVKHVQLNGEEYERVEHYPDRDRCPGGWSQIP
jgi:hypothetical protein